MIIYLLYFILTLCANTQLYERCSLGAIPTSGVSSQCPDTGIQLLCNLIKNICFSVRQLPLAHQLSYKQNFWIPVSSTGMTPFAVQFTFKNECSYSYGANTGIHAMDQVDIIAPSSKGKESDLTTIKEYVESLNFSPHISEKIYSNDNPFYSNSDEFRANDLIRALTDDSKIIWCIRGGEGASRLIPYLEKLPNDKKERIAQNKKILIGYSDITALHIYLQVKYDWETLHGTMLEMIVNNSVAESSVEKLKELILNKRDSIKFDNLKMINNGIRLKDGRLESKVIGGNMTLVENSIGTAWQINAKGKILFLEDVRVYPYAIERSLDHLKQAHIFDGVHAVIFGDFVNCYNDNLVEVVKERFAKSVNFPVFTMKGVGHGHINDPLPLNTHTTISIQNEKEGLFFMDVQNLAQLPFQSENNKKPVKKLPGKIQ